MIWFILLILSPVILFALLVIVEIAADWLHACSKLVAPWNDERPCKNKARTKVWFP